MAQNKDFTCSIDMKKGQEGVVAELDTNNKSILRKLMAMGVLPGVPIKNIQKYPTFVFQIGYTQMAVDREIAAVILVQT